MTRWDLVYKWADPETRTLVDAVTSALENCDRKLTAAEAEPSSGGALDNGRWSRSGWHYLRCWQSWASAWHPEEWECICPNLAASPDRRQPETPDEWLNAEGVDTRNG